MEPVRKAVILAAGMGTRMLPATKAVPKEMLPIVDTPLLQYAVEEAAAAGIEEVTFVIAEGKEAVREHFGNGGRVASILRTKGDAMLDAVERPGNLAKFNYVYQHQPLGPAHAVSHAAEFVAGEPFALFFADDLILGPVPCIGELIEAFHATGGSVIGVEEVTPEQVPSYGIVDPVGTAPGGAIALRGLVEKPRFEDAPSNLGIVGRYVLSATTFDHIERTRPAAGREHYVTEVLVSQLAAGEPVSAMRFKGVRYDTGRPLGYLVANVAAAFEREALRQPLIDRLRAFLGG